MTEQMTPETLKDYNDKPSSYIFLRKKKSDNSSLFFLGKNRAIIFPIMTVIESVFTWILI